MMRDDSTGGWLPMGGGGLANVSVRKRKIQHKEYDQPCRHEYIIHGKRIPDNSVTDISSLKMEFKYLAKLTDFSYFLNLTNKFSYKTERNTNCIARF
jgi:sprouty-related EVH1 domain-containing protein